MKAKEKVKEKGKQFALCLHTPKHIRGVWSHSTDTSEPVLGYVYIAIVQSGIRTSDLSITSPTRLPTAVPAEGKRKRKGKENVN
jgi:hypothetical protein